MLFLRDSSIRRKLSVVVFFTGLLGLSIASLAFEIYEKASFRASLVEDLTAQADALSMNTAAALAFNDLESAKGVLEALRVERHIVAACLYDKRGKVFAEYRREAATLGCQMTAPLVGSPRFDKEFVTISRSITLGGENTGAIALRSDFSRLQAKMKRFREISVLVLIVSLLATVLVSQRLIGLVTEPILQLAGLAERVSMREDYSLRAVATDKDELGKLVGSFNQMPVALTAHAMKGDREKRLAGGMDEYLTKPIRPQELDEVLKRYRARRVETTEAHESALSKK